MGRPPAWPASEALLLLRLVERESTWPVVASVITRSSHTMPAPGVGKGSEASAAF